jgi:hypothetical protein
MKMEFRVEPATIDGTITLDEPVSKDEQEVLALVRDILESAFPNAEFIEVDVI